MSILGPCMLEFQFSPETEWVLTSHHRVLVVLLASPFHKRRFLKVASRKEGGSLYWWEEMGEMRVRMMELELAWEQRDLPQSSGYVSLEEAVGEGEAVVGEEVEEEGMEIGEEGLWSPNSSDRAVLALVPDAPVFPMS
ncbi:hypothetical protein BDM02DRAFT_3133032 [Thelephora ganbajun]|uniref:Uncharacterized protein n=1 Tax=Thelephora ganbajun TaxID=370292 RepID=A0ACB6YYY5_THEGA|nr:hypothetical protein BDM02DRAFT_3133032 [Thelephora ganbajun]